MSIEARCPREEELLEALERGFVAPELAAHAEDCVECAELRAVVGALLGERSVAMAVAPVPSSGTTWWRIRLRERRETAESARRSLLVGQALSLAVALIVALVAIGAQLTVGLRDLGNLLLAFALGTPLAFAVGAWLLAAPLAGWLAIRQD